VGDNARGLYSDAFTINIILTSEYSRCPQHTPIETKQATQPEIPADTSTAKPLGKYACTSCQWNFTRKGDWKRHEDAHGPQVYWTCMLEEPAIVSSTNTSTTVWICAFCLEGKEIRTAMVEHLTVKHNFNVCMGKKFNEKTFYRKDKLKIHFQQVHALADSSPHWEAWHTDAPKKWAWGCGFCGPCLFTWEGKSEMHVSFFELSTLPDHFSASDAGIQLAQRLVVDHSGKLAIIANQARSVFKIVSKTTYIFSSER
jgi:hypothetical protein